MCGVRGALGMGLAAWDQTRALGTGAGADPGGDQGSQCSEFKTNKVCVPFNFTRPSRGLDVRGSLGGAWVAQSSSWGAWRLLEQSQGNSLPLLEALRVDLDTYVCVLGVF